MVQRVVSVQTAGVLSRVALCQRYAQRSARRCLRGGKRSSVLRAQCVARGMSCRSAQSARNGLLRARPLRRRVLVELSPETMKRALPAVVPPNQGIYAVAGSANMRAIRNRRHEKCASLKWYLLTHSGAPSRRATAPRHVPALHPERCLMPAPTNACQLPAAHAHAVSRVEIAIEPGETKQTCRTTVLARRRCLRLPGDVRSRYNRVQRRMVTFECGAVQRSQPRPGIQAA